MRDALSPVVTGMHGDGTSDGTQVYFLDPADGAPHHESFTAFAAHMEATAPPASTSASITTSFVVLDTQASHILGGPKPDSHARTWTAARSGR